VMEVLSSGVIGLEAIDNELVRYMQIKGMHPDYGGLLPEGGGWLLAEFGGDSKEEADAQAMKLIAKLKLKINSPSMKLYDNKEDEEHVWKVRESGLGATAFVPGLPPTWEGWEDSAVAPEKVGAYLRDLHKLYDKYGYQGALYGHFGQGCIHTRITFDFFSAQGIEKYKQFMD